MPSNGTLNSLCRKIRLLETELRSYRADVTILKREVNRLSKAGYKTASASAFNKDLERLLSGASLNGERQEKRYGGLVDG